MLALHGNGLGQGPQKFPGLSLFSSLNSFQGIALYLGWLFLIGSQLSIDSIKGLLPLMLAALFVVMRRLKTICFSLAIFQLVFGSE